jgi:hypothetical protein
MRRPFLLAPVAIAAACIAASAFSQDTQDAQKPRNQAQRESSQPVTVYRQVMPDGRVVYSDKAIKGGKLNHTITVEPPIEGNLWTTEAGNGPALAPQAEPTQVNRVNTMPPTASRKSLEEATSDVIRAEMLLEDAKARLQASSGGSAGIGGHAARQKWLARDLVEAEAALRQAVAVRDALRSNR